MSKGARTSHPFGSLRREDNTHVTRLICTVLSYKGRYTLGDKLQQQVAATDHSMCRGPSTSCSNTLRRHVATTNRLVCTGEFLRKSFSLQQSFVAATSRTNSVWFDFLRLVVVTKLCCGDKDFHKNSPAHTKRFVAATCRCNVLLQLVAKCVPTLIMTPFASYFPSYYKKANVRRLAGITLLVVFLSIFMRNNFKNKQCGNKPFAQVNRYPFIIAVRYE